MEHNRYDDDHTDKRHDENEPNNCAAERLMPPLVLLVLQLIACRTVCVHVGRCIA